MLIQRGKEIKKQHVNKRIGLNIWVSPENINEINFYIAYGFIAKDNCLVMGYNLKEEIPNVPQPNGIQIKQNPLNTEEDLKIYHNGAMKAFKGLTSTLNTT